MNDPFKEFMSHEGNEVTVEYVPDTGRYMATLLMRVPDPNGEFFLVEEVMLVEAESAALAVLKLQATFNKKKGGPSVKLSKRARKQYEQLTDGQLITMADGLSSQMERYARAGDLREAKGVARELERLEVILQERGLYEAWMEPKMLRAALTMNELLGGKRNKES